MRIVDLHRNTTSAPSLGQGIDPKSDIVGLTAKISGASGDAVDATFSVMGSMGGVFDREPILFGGASIISLSGTTSAQWSEIVEKNRYVGIGIDLLTMGASTISFNARATDSDR
jgi:hypothetical protein